MFKRPQRNVATAAQPINGQKQLRPVNVGEALRHCIQTVLRFPTQDAENRSATEEPATRTSLNCGVLGLRVILVPPHSPH